MEEVIQKCTNCKQIPDDILMLSCDHDLCLNCAAIIFCSENNQVESKLLTCLECWKTTELDQQSIYELKKINVELQIQKKINSSDIKKYRGGVQNNDFIDQRINDSRNQIQPGLNYNNNSSNMNQQDMMNSQNSNMIENTNQPKVNENIIINNNHHQIINEQQQPQIFNQQYKQQQQIMVDIPSGQKINQQQLQLQQQQQQQQLYQNQPQKRFCQDHSEEEILYFCFQCQSRCICPECVIHGAHKNHEVKTIKKSYPIIKQKVEEFSQKIDIKLKQINQRRIHLESVSQELEGNATSLKKQIALVFTEIRQRVEEKEKEIYQICDQVLSQNLKEIENINFCLEEKIIEFKQTLELVFDHENQPDETLLLDFYATNQVKLEEIKESREWEKKLLYSNPDYYQVSQREIQKQLALIENQLQKIDLQIEVKDQPYLSNQNNQNGLNEMQNSQVGTNSQNSQINTNRDQLQQQQNISSNQMNNSGIIQRDYQHQTPSHSNSKNQSNNHIYKPPLTSQSQQQIHKDQQSLTQRSPVYKQLEDPFRTQKLNQKDIRISDADFDKLREKLVNKSRLQSSPGGNNKYSDSKSQNQQSSQLFQKYQPDILGQNQFMNQQNQQQAINSYPQINQNSQISNQNSLNNSSNRIPQNYILQDK